MAIPTGTVETYDIKGEREDLQDAIYMISPVEVPFMSSIGRGRASAVYHEWQTDVLNAPAPEWVDGMSGENAQIEGDDARAPDHIATVRPGNYTQIMSKTVIVSGTADAIDKAGRKSETAREIMKAAKELKRDMETVLTSNQASNAGASGTPRRMGGATAWYETNTDFGGSGADGGFSGGTVSKRTDGTQRALVESMLKNVIRLSWEAGGDPTLVMSGSFNRQVISAFTGNATRFDKSEDQRLVATYSVYVSDFGEHRVVPNRFQRKRDVHVVDPSLWSVAYLRSFRQKPLADTGDSTKRFMTVEFTLCSKNEQGSGLIADLTTS